MACDICGRGEGKFNISVEGGVLNVCDNCTKFGGIMNDQSKVTPKKVQSSKDDLIYFVSGYGSLIKSCREKMGLSQEDLAKKINEKLSLIQHIETEKMHLDIKLGKKFERFFGIKLFDNSIDIKIESTSKNSGVLTIGDLIKK